MLCDLLVYYKLLIFLLYIFITYFSIELYISRDVDLVSMLVQLRQAGKKLFLLTNSQWQYADAVMDFLVQNEWVV